jgi:hypothetical protein
MHTSYNFTDAQRLLIKPFERLGFVIVFVLTTGLSQVVAYLVFHQPAFGLLWESNRIQYGIVTGIITGSFIGASQWLILRKYVSTWKWILVEGLSTTVINTYQTISDLWKESLIASNLFRQEILLWGIVTILISLGLVFISGYLQWYVLRPYIAKALWWIIIPLISVLVCFFVLVLTGGIPFGLIFLKDGFLYGFSAGVQKLNTDVIQLSLFPATQAIAFCILKNKSLSENSVLQSPLALAPDIVNYRDIKRLERILYRNISGLWKTDLVVSIGQLTYFIGVNRMGQMFIGQPMNQVSSDNIDQTPLLELARDPNDIPLTSEEINGFAKFQVIFTPPSTVEIYSWRGIPLVWLGSAVYAAIIGINILCAWLKIDILTFVERVHY